MNKRTDKAQPVELETTNAADPETISVLGDLSKLRLSQDFHKQAGVVKALVRVPVRKPDRQEFVRVNPAPEYRFDTGMLELKDDREFYLLAPDVRDQLPEDDWVAIRLVTAITRKGDVFLWPLKLPNPDGRANSWYTTAIAGADLAETKWTKVVANMNLKGYDSLVAIGELSDPVWPDHSFERLLEVAFRDLYISSMDHPVINRLLGYE